MKHRIVCEPTWKLGVFIPSSKYVQKARCLIAGYSKLLGSHTHERQFIMTFETDDEI